MSDIEARIRAALDDVHIESGRKDEHEAVVQRVLQAARQAHESGEVEPVAYLMFAKDGRVFGATVNETTAFKFAADCRTDVTPLYTHPPAKVPEAGSHEMNEAAWRFIESLPEGEFRRAALSCKHLKPAIHAAVSHLLATPTPATPPETELPDELLSEKGILIDLLRNAASAERKVDTCYDEPNKNPRLAKALNWLADFVANGFEYPPQGQ